MIPNHTAVVEAASWRIGTELCRRTPALSIYQYHPGGGQNDCLALLHPTLGTVADLNRSGTFHARRRLDTGEPARDECWPVWEEVTHTPMRDLVNRASAQIGQAVPARLPASVPRVVVYRSIAAILALYTFAPVMWSCQSAFIDSSDFGGCGSHPVLASFPAAEAALRAEVQTDSERSGVGTWLVLRGEEPLLCLREDGRVWTLDGEAENVVVTYGRSRRILAVVYPLLATIADL